MTDEKRVISERLFGQLQVLTPDEIERIHDSAIRILSSVGVQFDDPVAREALQRAGSTVVGSVVHIPVELVNWALEAQPERVVLGAKVDNLTIELGQQRFVTTNGFGTSSVLDPLSGSLRPATCKDLMQLTILADALDEVGYCQHQTTPQDIPQDRLDVAQAFIVLANTSKHVHLSTYTADYGDEVIELGAIAGDTSDCDHPVFSLGCCSISPLRYPREATTLLRKATRLKVPFLLVSGAVAGVMSPVTLAGTLAVQTAEHLAGLVLAQTYREGMPIAFGSFSSPMDPRDGRQRLGVAELSLLNGATAQLCRRYNVPFGYGTGGVTDSSEVGVQTGLEKALTMLGAAVAGVEVIHDAVSGILASGLVVSYEEMLIDEHLCRIVRRFLQGIRITDDTLALEEIQRLGPSGNYLATLYTARHFREEILLSSLWEAGSEGTETVVRKARDEVKVILKKPRAPAVSADQFKRMVRIWSRVGLEEGKAHQVVHYE